MLIQKCALRRYWNCSIQRVAEFVLFLYWWWMERKCGEMRRVFYRGKGNKCVSIRVIFGGVLFHDSEELPSSLTFVSKATVGTIFLPSSKCSIIPSRLAKKRFFIILRTLLISSKDAPELSKKACMIWWISLLSNAFGALLSILLHIRSVPFFLSFFP